MRRDPLPALRIEYSHSHARKAPPLEDAHQRETQRGFWKLLNAPEHSQEQMHSMQSIAEQAAHAAGIAAAAKGLVQKSPNG